MLYPENHRYLADVLSYVAVGARSVENRQNRLTASGLDLPVGMNATSGDLSVMQLRAGGAGGHGSATAAGRWKAKCIQHIACFAGG